MYVAPTADWVFALLMSIQAYDSHCNLVLGEVEETIYVIEDDDDEEEVKVGLGKGRSLPLMLKKSLRQSKSSQRCSSSEVSIGSRSLKPTIYEH